MLQNFETYQMAKKLYKACEKVKTRNDIKDQLMRASLSVVLNLAEGSAKPTVKDRRRFYSISYASVREVRMRVHPDLFGAMLYRLRENTQ